MATKRIINVNVLPGEPLDGSGRVCIHMFVKDERGPFTEPLVIHIENNQPVAKPTRGRLACDPNRLVAPVMRNGVTTVTMRTDDARAVTCPKCQKSTDYVSAMELLKDK